MLSDKKPLQVQKDLKESQLFQKEIEQFMTSKQFQKDYKVVESTCFEMRDICYDIYMHLKKMEKCCFTSKGYKIQGQGIVEKYVFYSTKEGKKVQ